MDRFKYSIERVANESATRYVDTLRRKKEKEAQTREKEKLCGITWKEVKVEDARV